MIFQSIKYLCLRIVPSTTVFSGCLWTLTIYWFSQISTITERSFPYKQWNLHILKLNYFGSSNKSIQMQQKKSLNQYQRFCDSHKIEKYKSLYIFYNFFFLNQYSWCQFFCSNLLYTHHISGIFAMIQVSRFWTLDLHVYITKYSICRSYIRYCLL